MWGRVKSIQEHKARRTVLQKRKTAIANTQKANPLSLTFR